MKLGVQIELDGHFLLSVLGLPPSSEPILRESCDNVGNVVTVGVGLRPWLTRVTGKALFNVTNIANDTISLRIIEATRRRGLQEIFSPNQQVACGWVTTPSQTYLLSILTVN